MECAPLLDEEFDKVLIMDWPLDKEMAGQKLSKAERRKQAAASNQDPPSAPIPAVTKEEVEDIVAARISLLQSNPVAPASPPITAKWWNRPLGSAIVGGLVVLIVGGIIGGIVAHASRDSATQIADEITRQLDQRSSREADNLNNRIAAEVAKQLGPVHQQLEGLSQDIGKIKDNLHIAQSRPPEPSPLRQFAALDQVQFSRVLVRVADAVNDARRRGMVSDLETIDTLQRKVASIGMDNPAAFRAALAVISYASFVREKTGVFPDAPRIRSQTCSFIGVEGAPPPKDVIWAHVTNPHVNGCSVKLDGISITGGTIENAIVTYEGGAFELKNVQFINCLFVISLPSTPLAPAKNFAGEILARNVGPKPTFTASVS